MSGKDRGQKTTKKPAQSSLKEKRAAKRSKSEPSDVIPTTKRG
ncbi:hypothetical protein JOF28_002438 [Leucobacter exalbidus]|uniref:Uncharacterized protein n=1 Tax=Leucobacter exalbidus TaxID=662960 RepID=A0A940PZZ4_9MICO|nr:hypothetical protein [Leucobacter exalbidus]MBP1327206.1 hypothetical protein [Leucobacter exalbidus]